MALSTTHLYIMNIVVFFSKAIRELCRSPPVQQILPMDTDSVNAAEIRSLKRA